jgi:hypothetical protein
MTTIAALTIICKKTEQCFQELSAEENSLLSTVIHLYKDLITLKGVMIKIEYEIQNLVIVDNGITIICDQTRALYRKLWDVEQKYHDKYKKFKEIKNILQATTYSLIQIDKEKKLLTIAITASKDIK